MLSPATFSMTSIAIMQEYSTSLKFALQMLFWDMRQAGKCVTDIKVLYETANIQNQIVDGTVEYPQPADEADTSKGMDIELRCVFSRDLASADTECDAGTSPSRTPATRQRKMRCGMYPCASLRGALR